jgi:Flp pilus assembly protein TadD
VAEIREALRLNPKDAGAHTSLGVALRAKGDLGGAITSYRAAIRLDPRFEVAHYNLGNALKATGDADGAVASYRAAIRINPSYAYVHNGLAWVLATGPNRVRDGERAVELASRACELTGWKGPNHLDTLAAAYAEAGDFDRAVEHQKKALSFPAFEKANGTKARQRLDLYARKAPYRDPALADRPAGQTAPPARPTK